MSDFAAYLVFKSQQVQETSRKLSVYGFESLFEVSRLAGMLVCHVCYGANVENE